MGVLTTINQRAKEKEEKKQSIVESPVTQMAREAQNNRLGSDIGDFVQTEAEMHYVPAITLASANFEKQGRGTIPTNLNQEKFVENAQARNKELARDFDGNMDDRTETNRRITTHWSQRK